MTNKIILGIDPGIAKTGYGLISQTREQLEVITYGCLTTQTGIELPERIKQIFQALDRLIKKYRPIEVVVEEIFFCKNVKTALKVGQARGAVLLVAMLNELQIREFTPLQVKQALTGYGRADKLQIQKMVQTILRLEKLPKPDDAADALAIAICAAHTEKLGS